MNKLARICYGTWGFDGASYGKIKFQECLELAQYAAECGVKLFDTSDFYGYGKSELVLGEALELLSGDLSPRIATKAGLLPHSSFDMLNNFSRPYLEHSLTKSISRLRRKEIDLWQLHSPALSDLSEICKNFKWFDSLKSSGLIKKIGVSTRSPSDAIIFLREYQFDAVQVNFNLLDQRLLDVSLETEAISKGIELIVRTPLAFGFLTGNITPDTKFELSDHRNKWSREQKEKWYCGVSEFEDIRKELKMSKVEFALAYARSIPGVSYVNVGMMNLNDIKQNLSIFKSATLSYETLKAIRGVYLNSVFSRDPIKR
jgi:aryl-alcohol dehydrogenase-like predicted oxidoreductase